MSQCSAEDLATLETSGIMDELRTMQTAMNYVCVEHIDGKNSRAAYSVYARGDNGSAGRGSWVKWVNKCEWVTWVTGQYHKTLDPSLGEV